MKRHRPVPGPAYWDWRCRVCGIEVRHTGYHLRWWEGNRANIVLALLIVAILVYGCSR